MHILTIKILQHLASELLKMIFDFLASQVPQVKELMNKLVVGVTTAVHEVLEEKQTVDFLMVEMERNLTLVLGSLFR